MTTPATRQIVGFGFLVLLPVIALLIAATLLYTHIKESTSDGSEATYRPPLIPPNPESSSSRFTFETLPSCEQLTPLVAHPYFTDWEITREEGTPSPTIQSQYEIKIHCNTEVTLTNPGSPIRIPY